MFFTFLGQDTNEVCRLSSARVNDQCEQQILYWFRPDNTEPTTPCLPHCQPCYDCLAAVHNTSELNTTLWETLYPQFFESENNDTDDDDDSSSESSTVSLVPDIVKGMHYTSTKFCPQNALKIAHDSFFFNKGVVRGRYWCPMVTHAVERKS